MTIKTPGWPLGADIACAICGTVWTLDVGDAARIVVAPTAGTITVDAACPGCDTLYTATKTIGAHRSPDWMMAEQQSNVEEPSEPAGGNLDAEMTALEREQQRVQIDEQVSAAKAEFVTIAKSK